jgi:hypothetical protein
MLMPAAITPQDGRLRRRRPALGDERDAIGPHAADPEAHEKPQHEHLLLRRHEGAGGRAQRIKKDAHPQPPTAAEAVAEPAEHDPTDRRAEHQGCGVAGKPVAAGGRREGLAHQALGHRKRRHGHQPQLEPVEHEPEERRDEHGHARTARHRSLTS